MSCHPENRTINAVIYFLLIKLISFHIMLLELKFNRYYGTSNASENLIKVQIICCLL